MTKPIPVGSWKIRRRVMFLALLYCAIHVSWMIFFGPATSLHEQALIALIGAGTAIIGSYVFGAVWDDNNRRNFHVKRGANDEPGKMKAPLEDLAEDLKDE